MLVFGGLIILLVTATGRGATPKICLISFSLDLHDSTWFLTNKLYVVWIWVSQNVLYCVVCQNKTFVYAKPLQQDAGSWLRGDEFHIPKVWPEHSSKHCETQLFFEAPFGRGRLLTNVLQRFPGKKLGHTGNHMLNWQGDIRISISKWPPIGSLSPGAPKTFDTALLTWESMVPRLKTELKILAGTKNGCQISGAFSPQGWVV